MRYSLFIALVMAAACVEPSPDPSDPGDPSDPSGTPAPGGGGGSGSNTSTCIQAATPPSSGHHNAGSNCQGCHTGAGGAPLWTAAGTLYGAGGAALPGATVTIVDAAGKSIALVTAQNGNFWTGDAVQAPLRVKASLCPSSASMSATAGGACNSCHTASGTPGRIQLP
jgi:hypothetical protein